MDKGSYIVVEGIDGAGTTTQASLLAEELRRKYPDREVLVTKEPSNTPVTNIIRQSLSRTGTKLSKEGLLFAFLLDREMHMRDVVIPALERGAIVIQDRGKLSTLAYQSVSLGKDFVHSCINHQLDPDLYVVVDVPVEIANARVANRGAPMDDYEANLNFQRQVASNYMSAAYESCHTPSVFVHANEAGPVEVADRIAAMVKESIGL